MVSYQGITVRRKSFGFWDMWSRLDLGAMVFARIYGSAVCSASGHMHLIVKLALCSLNLGSQLPQGPFSQGLPFFSELTAPPITSRVISTRGQHDVTRGQPISLSLQLHPPPARRSRSLLITHPPLALDLSKGLSKIQ